MEFYACADPSSKPATDTTSNSDAHVSSNRDAEPPTHGQPNASPELCADSASFSGPDLEVTFLTDCSSFLCSIFNQMSSESGK